VWWYQSCLSWLCWDEPWQVGHLLPWQQSQPITKKYVTSFLPWQKSQPITNKYVSSLLPWQQSQPITTKYVTCYPDNNHNQSQSSMTIYRLHKLIHMTSYQAEYSPLIVSWSSLQWLALSYLQFFPPQPIEQICFSGIDWRISWVNELYLAVGTLPKYNW